MVEIKSKQEKNPRTLYTQGIEKRFKVIDENSNKFK
jgi:hypothetical protein